MMSDAMAAAVTVSCEGDAGDWGGATWDDPLSPYEIPGPGWTWDPMNRFMVAPDGTPFDPDYIPDLNKMYELEKELQAGRDAGAKADAHGNGGLGNRFVIVSPYAIGSVHGEGWGGEDFL